MLLKCTEDADAGLLSPVELDLALVDLLDRVDDAAEACADAARCLLTARSSWAFFASAFWSTLWSTLLKRDTR